MADISTNRQVKCANCPFGENETFRKLGDDQLKYVQDFKIGELKAESGGTLFLEGTHGAHIYTVLEGWAFRYKMLEDGRRQILNFALPGDLIGLQGAILDEMEHSVEALTDMVLCVFSRDRLWEVFERYPGLSFDLTWLASREECILDGHLLSVGRRSGLERTAYLLLHLYLRAKASASNEPRKVPFPFTQQHLSDALGMSTVHTNRMIRRLTDRGLISWKDGKFEVLDRDALEEIAGTDPNAQIQRPYI